MAEKRSGAVLPNQPGQMPEAPPSYEASMAAAGPSAGASNNAGGFTNPSSYPKQQGPVPASYVPPTQQVPAQPPVIVQYVQAPNFGPHPVNMTCPHCQSQVRTSTDSEPGPMAWILAGILCVVGLWPCACVPCCIESLNSVTHKCPQCRNFLGRYKGGL